MSPPKINDIINLSSPKKKLSKLSRKESRRFTTYEDSPNNFRQKKTKASSKNRFKDEEAIFERLKNIDIEVKNIDDCINWKPDECKRSKKVEKYDYKLANFKMTDNILPFISKRREDNYKEDLSIHNVIEKMKFEKLFIPGNLTSDLTKYQKKISMEQPGFIKKKFNGKMNFVSEVSMPKNLNQNTYKQVLNENRRFRSLVKDYYNGR